MRILMTSSWFPSRKHATLGNFVQRHIEAIALQHEVVVLVCFRMDEGNEVEVVKSVENGVAIYRVYATYKKWQVWQAKHVFRYGWQSIQNDGHAPFDIVHHHVIYPIGILAASLAQEIHVPLVVTEHWTIYNKKVRSDQPKWLKWASKRVAAKASVICPVSVDLADTMMQFGLPSNYHVIPNVVDTAAFKIDQPAPGFHFLHISSLDERHKNISGILRAWAIVSRKMPDAKLHVGGDGPFEFWRSQAKAMDISDESIVFFGECTSQEVALRMNLAHCFVMFSRFENLPVVIVEAMSAGLPIISSQVGGIAEHVTKERGMLVRSEQEDELVAAMFAMRALWPDYNRFEIRQYAIKHFGQEAISCEYDGVYKRVLEKGN